MCAVRKITLKECIEKCLEYEDRAFLPYVNVDNELIYDHLEFGSVLYIEDGYEVHYITTIGEEVVVKVGDSNLKSFSLPSDTYKVFNFLSLLNKATFSEKFKINKALKTVSSSMSWCSKEDCNIITFYGIKDVTDSDWLEFPDNLFITLSTDCSELYNIAGTYRSDIWSDGLSVLGYLIESALFKEGIDIDGFINRAENMIMDKKD